MKYFFLLISLMCNAQQIQLSWPTNYGQATVEYSSNGMDWSAIATGEFTNIVLDATNWNNDGYWTNLLIAPTAGQIWVADCYPHNMYRVMWDYTNGGYWVPDQSWPLRPWQHISAHWELPSLNNKVTITKL